MQSNQQRKILIGFGTKNTYFCISQIKKNTIMIRLNVFISVEDVNRAKVLDAAKELTAASVKEDGCIAYDIYESATRGNVLLICETWKDSESLSSHETTAAFIKNIAILKELTAIKVEKFEF